MKLETFTFFPDKGWSVASFPAIDSPSTLVLVFGAPSYLKKPAPIEELIAAYPESHIVGCSTAGEIFESSIYDESLTVAVAKFKSTRITSASTQVNGTKDSYRAGELIASQLRAPDLKTVFVLSNGTDINGSELVRALNNNLPEQVVVTGGLAGDGDRFEKTWVIKDRTLATDCVCAVGFYGESIRVGHGSKGGWDVFGPQRRVTRSEDNVLFELDGRPALDLYKEYLGALASGLPSSALLFPLSLRTDPNDEKSVVRTILNVNEEEKSLTFAGDVPTGHYAQLMKANSDRLINGASEAAFIASNKDDAVAPPTLSIAISCVGRRLVLGERTEEELEATLEVLPEGVQQIGFYSYGEISPYASGSCDLHNQTMTLTIVQEA